MNRSVVGIASTLALVGGGALLLSGRPALSSARVASDLPVPLIGAALATSSSRDTAVFAGGCFWGIEGVFEHLRGVENAVSGFAGGTSASANYATVSSGRTRHAEAVEVVYDPSQISYGQLLQVFFSVAHDPTQLNRQGPDVGPQYRSAVFYRTDEQRKAVEGYVAQLTASQTYVRPIVTEVAPLERFFAAEEYHQNYMEKHPTNPYIVFNDAPKIEHLRKRFPALFREGSAS